MQQPSIGSDAMTGPLALGDRIGPYEATGLLGSGGTATVYRAQHSTLGSVHALKVLTLDRPSLRLRTLNEGRVQATMRHPNLVAVTEIVHDPQGAPALVMEYVPGPSLGQLLAHHRPRLAEVDLLVRGILRGMAAAHDRGVVHRDLKPSNVLLSIVDGRLVPKITDFGLVKLFEGPGSGTLTQAGQPMGTPAYMPPEQFRDASQADKRADVWALGVLMYELCAGKLPFDDETQARLLDPATATTFAPSFVEVPGLPQRMVRAIAGALHIDPAYRFADARALAEAWCGGISDDQVWASFDREPSWNPATLAVAMSLQADDPDTRIRPVSPPMPLPPTEIAPLRPQPPGAVAQLSVAVAFGAAMLATICIAGLIGAAIGLAVWAPAAGPEAWRPVADQRAQQIPHR